MSYRSYIPTAPLNQYIDDLYFIDGASPYTHLKVLPMPSLHLMVNFGDAFQVHEPEQATPFAACAESYCVGLWSHYYTVEWPRNVHFFGIHFKAAGAYPFLQMPLTELHNQVVPLDALWKDAAEIRERLYDAPTIEAGFALLEQLLLERLCEASSGLAIVQHAIGEIACHHGTQPIRTLSDHIGISQNHLGTLFKRLVGIPPKELARFYRFAHLLGSIDPTQKQDWTLLAHQFCFYDQAHFNKEFMALTGHTPTTYLQLRRQLHSQNPEQAQNLGQMPID
jgi:AraC-like DNA-binding protein